MPMHLGSKLKTALAGALALFLVLANGAVAAPRGKLIVFHAGSLTAPFAAMEKEFESLYPGLDLMREAGGSTKMARLISQAGKPADIMASADYEVIDKNLIPAFAETNIRFATNQLVLCYTKGSRHAAEVNAENWPEILARPGVEWGHSDPDLDPCGYRALMVIELAEIFYQRPGLAQRLMAGRNQANIRPKSVELVALLKTGNLDYAWEYLSVAVQHGLDHVRLPGQINLGDSGQDEFYQRAVVRVAGKRPGELIEMRGKSCTYGVALLKNSPNPEAAAAFLAYLLDPAGGLAVLERMGQPPIAPARAPSQEMVDRLPERVRPLVTALD